MREKKPGDRNAESHQIVVLQQIPHHQGLVKANRLLVLLASTLMVAVFVMGFFLIPGVNLPDRKIDSTPLVASTQVLQNPALSDEINVLKGQLVGLVSGSIESKLRILEDSIRTGSVNASLGTIQDLKNDVEVLKSYSRPEKKTVANPINQQLVEEVTHLKRLIYLTIASCSLMLAAIAGFWFKKRYRLADSNGQNKPGLTYRD